MLIRYPDFTRGKDLNETPEVGYACAASRGAASAEDPASCVRGAISRVLRSAGHTVIENDIADYGRGQDSAPDFLHFKPAQAGVAGTLISNPSIVPADGALLLKRRDQCRRF